MFAVISPYLKFMSPVVVEAIVQDNMKNKQMFIDILESRKINSEIYIWDGSACIFPGARRYVGKQEKARIAVVAEKRKEKQAIYLDDNSLPVHFWSFILRGKKASN